jgi:hypothetical protein
MKKNLVIDYISPGCLMSIYMVSVEHIILQIEFVSIFNFSVYCSLYQFTHPHMWILRISCLLILTFLWVYSGVSIVVLICISQIANEVKHLFLYLIRHFLWHANASVLPIFVLGCLYFSYWFVFFKYFGYKFLVGYKNSPPFPVNFLISFPTILPFD